jgi:hypothetical protein
MSDEKEKPQPETLLDALNMTDKVSKERKSKGVMILRKSDDDGKPFGIVVAVTGLKETLLFNEMLGTFLAMVESGILDHAEVREVKQ